MRGARIPLGAVLAALLFATAAPRVRADGAPASGAALHEVFLGLEARQEATRLAALDRLAALVAADGHAGQRALPRLGAVLRRRGPAERARVVALLLGIPGEEALKLWLERLDPEVEGDDRVLAAAVAATATCARPREVERALLDAVRDAHAGPAFRALAYEALGGLPGPVADLVLGRARDAEPWVEACGRARGLGRRPGARSVMALLGLWARAGEVAPRLQAWESLLRITRAALPFDLKRWQAWAAAPAAGAGAPPGAAGPRYAPARPVHVPHYYGIPIRRPGSRVVFCLDVSQSMYGGGIDSARRHLRRTLMEMPSDDRFEIVAFNGKVMPWRGRLVRAHPVQKYFALRFLASLETISYTNLYDAVETAFGYAGRGPRARTPAESLDAIFLLSDGEPNRGRYRDEKHVVEGIAAMSRGDIPVHTIGAGEEVFPLLRAIARATGGTFADAFE